MIIDCVSDMHGAPIELEGGDLLIIAGDLTRLDDPDEYLSYFQWLSEQNYERIIWIAGNHDGCLAKPQFMPEIKNSPYFPKSQRAKKIEYLEDSGTEYRGLKIWGSPWTPTFYNWYFMKDRGPKIKAMWDKIPFDTDILITHGPPFGILDKIHDTVIDSYAGCVDLMNKIKECPQLKLHVFGHIHESYGVKEENKINFINASIMNEEYEPVNKPIRIIL